MILGNGKIRSTQFQAMMSFERESWEQAKSSSEVSEWHMSYSHPVNLRSSVNVLAHISSHDHIYPNFGMTVVSHCQLDLDVMSRLGLS